MGSADHRQGTDRTVPVADAAGHNRHGYNCGGGVAKCEAATAWAWCLAGLGLAVRYLARPSAVLVTLNRAVFPVYELHFPVTLVGLAIAAQVSLPWGIEFLGLVVFVYARRFFDEISKRIAADRVKYDVVTDYGKLMDVVGHAAR